MNPSVELCDFTKRSENAPLFLASPGTVCKAYPDAGGWSIGYGHHSDSVTEGMEWTKEQAEAAFAQDIDTAAYKTAKFAGRVKDQGQFDCLVDFFYNVKMTTFLGSHLQKTLEEGDLSTVPAQLYRVDPDGSEHGWIFSRDEDGREVVNEGLVARRQGEIKFWNGEQA